MRFDLISWLTILNDNGQSFADAELMAVAGTLNVTSDFAGPGRSADGAPAAADLLSDRQHGGRFARAAYPAIRRHLPPPATDGAMADDDAIVVTGSRSRRAQ